MRKRAATESGSSFSDRRSDVAEPTEQRDQRLARRRERVFDVVMITAGLLLTLVILKVLGGALHSPPVLPR